MSSKRKMQDYVAGRYDVETLVILLQEWEEYRRIRDMGGGDRHMSEAILEQITGKKTEFELFHGMLNAYEQEAEKAFQDWRESLSFEPQDEGQEPVRRDLSTEIFKFYELLRVVKASGDKELIKAWMLERSWSEKILIPLLLSQKPSRRVITPRWE